MTGMQLRRRRVQHRVQIALWRERTHRPSTPHFHASDRPAAPPRRRWVLLSIGIPSQRFRWFQGEPAARRRRPGNVCGRSLQQPRQGLARTPRRRRSSWSRQRADPCRPIAPLALIASRISDACAWRWCGPCCYVNGSLAHARRRRRQACGSSSTETAASSMSSKYYGLPPPGPARCHLRRTLIASATRRSTAPKLRRSGCGS